MRMHRALALLAAAGALAALAPSSGSADPTYESNRCDRAITIDGEATEWAGREARYDEEDGYKLGFFNDEEYLYVYFATWNLSTQQRVLTSGLTVWLDGGGKKKKTFGINYPRGRDRGPGSGFPAADGAAPGEIPREARGEAPRSMQRPGANPDPAKLAALLNETQAEALLKSPAGDSVLLLSPADSSAAGLRAMLRARSRLLVIELRVPLDPGAASPYALHAVPGRTISVGFETGTMERPKLTRPQGMPEDDQTGGGMPPGGGGNAPGGGMFPGGGAGGPGGMGAPEGLKLWVKVKLAP